MFSIFVLPNSCVLRLESQFIGHVLFLQQSFVYRNERGSISSEIKLTEHISHLEQILINSGKRAKLFWLETKSNRKPKLTDITSTCFWFWHTKNHLVSFQMMGFDKIPTISRLFLPTSLKEPCKTIFGLS